MEELLLWLLCVLWLPQFKRNFKALAKKVPVNTIQYHRAAIHRPRGLIPSNIARAADIPRRERLCREAARSSNICGVPTALPNSLRKSLAY